MERAAAVTAAWPVDMYVPGLLAHRSVCDVIGEHASTGRKKPIDIPLKQDAVRGVVPTLGAAGLSQAGRPHSAILIVYVDISAAATYGIHELPFLEGLFHGKHVISNNEPRFPGSKHWAGRKKIGVFIPWDVSTAKVHQTKDKHSGGRKRLGRLLSVGEHYPEAGVRVVGGNSRVYITASPDCSYWTQLEDRSFRPQSSGEISNAGGVPVIGPLENDWLFSKPVLAPVLAEE